jgi:hypothetical protein
MDLTKDQFADIEKYASRAAFQTIKMVRDYSSFMARDIGTRYEDKFTELMFCEISKIFCEEAEAMREKNLAFENENCLEIVSMIRNLNLDIEELNKKVTKLAPSMENDSGRS